MPDARDHDAAADTAPATVASVPSVVFAKAISSSEKPRSTQKGVTIGPIARSPTR